MTESSPDITVIVPVRNAASSLQRCLDALALQEQPPSFEVVVVDNGSSDGTNAVASEHPLRPCVLVESRVGAYAARNAGLQVANGRIVAFTDADCAPMPGWLRAGQRAMRPGVDLVGGAVKQSLSDRPTLWEVYDAATYLDMSWLIQAHGFAPTANLMVRTTVFDAVGPFDGALISAGDAEFGHRAAAAGFHLVYEPEAVVRHAPRRSFGEFWRLHRRLGAGWAALARQGRWEGEGIRTGVPAVVRQMRARVRDAEVSLRTDQFVAAFAVSLCARVVGRVTGK